MRILKIVLGLLLLIGISWGGNTRFGMLPPVLKFLDPFGGFWQNAELTDRVDSVMVKGTRDNASVTWDERGVPHIFASNEFDLYYLQGYLTARDRLWQMEFQTHAAAGRLSEIIGGKAIDFDLEQRRIGMTYAAEKALKLIEQDAVSMNILSAYTAGVNQYVSELDESSLPLEYKLLDYKPEPWNIYKSGLLLKYMAKMLNGTENDRANTEALKLLGKELFWKLYPDQTYLEDPIVPGFKVDTNLLDPIDPFTDAGSFETPYVQPRFIGSNNWAVSGARTESGNAILCNDPHLRLSLPSIWYEVQLSAPGINCYGVSLPGSPGVTIGFNEKIAWGVTNAGRDVKDYYSIDLNEGHYSIGDTTYKLDPRIEIIKVRGDADVIDTVLYTVYGPIAHSSENGKDHLALRWLAHDASNELRTFYDLNRASGFDDYSAALEHYNCPGQNFVFADVENNIAIWQQGKFKMKQKGYGKFVLNGADSENLEERFIPKEQNPHMFNPERGFVSSANQAAVDDSYPYYVSGVYEEFRNRTINRFLRSDSSITIGDMQNLQLSNYNLLAEEALPLLLNYLDTSRFQNDYHENLAYKLMNDWNYSNDRGIISPTVFEIWWDEFNALLWDELNDKRWNQDEYYRYSWEQMARDGKAKIDMRDKRYVYPMNKVTIDLLKNEPNHQMFDHHFTPDKVEVAQDIVYDAFYWTAMKLGDIIKYNHSAPHWGHYQGTRVRHLLRIDALSTPKLFVGGSEHAPNATTGTHGPSWRMIVELDKDGPIAYGVLPGGQSGNAGSSKFTYSVGNWAKGEYHRLHLLKAPSEAKDGWQTIKISSKKE